MAVRNPMGLNMDDSHTENGGCMPSPSVQSRKNSTRAMRSLNCGRSFLLEGHAAFSHRHRSKGLRPGHWEMPRAIIR